MPTTASRAARRDCGIVGRCDAKFVALLAIVWVFCLGASLAERPVQILTRKAICRELYEIPDYHQKNILSPPDNPLCQTEEVNDALAQANLDRQVVQAVGGFFFSAIVLEQTDRYGRLVSMWAGSIIWMVSFTIMFWALGDWSLGWCWVFAAVGSVARILVEGSALAMANDLSDDRRRSANYANVLYAALLAQIFALLDIKALNENGPGAAFFAGIVSVLIGMTACMAYGLTLKETLQQQEENWQADEGEETDGDTKAPIKVIGTALNGPGWPLLGIATTVVPLASATKASFEAYMPAAFNHNSKIGEQNVAGFGVLCGAISAVAFCGTFMNWLLSRNPRRLPQRRDYSILWGSVVMLGLGCFFILMPNKASAVIGILLMSFSAGILPFAIALVLQQLGADIRSKLAGSFWGFAYMLQNAATLVISPAMSIPSREEPGSKKQFICLVIACVWILYLVYRSERMWPDVGRRTERDDLDVELRELEGDAPRAPPPAYTIESRV